MYNILITDDEQIVVDSLFFVMNKNFEGQVKLFSANSGSDAINIVSQNQIDIVFMDINMPGMTGLETIKCILNLNPQAIIIILSAFDTFEYAQEALNLGAYKYLTKPMNRNLVVQTVRGAMNVVDQRKSGVESDSELREKIEKISPVLEGDFFYSCIFNRSKSVDAYTFLDYFKIMQDNFAISCMEILSEEASEREKIYSVLRDELHSRAKCFVSSIMVDRVIAFFWFDNSDDINKNVQASMRELYSQIEEKKNIKLRVGVSPVFNDASEIAAQYKNALFSMNSTDRFGGISFSDTGSTQVNTAAGEAEEKEILVRLYNRLKIGDSAGLKFLLTSYVDYLESNGSDIEKIKANIFEILVNVKNIIMDSDAHYEFPSSYEIWRVLTSVQDKGSVYAYAEQEMDKVSLRLYEIKKSKKNPVIIKVLEYVDAHLSESISLEKTAAAVGVNPFYLSKLFREETGDTFINYVSDKRMENAKRLLSSSMLSIKEITASIGYNDQNYFSKMFKAKFGISPTEFRRVAVEE